MAGCAQSLHAGICGAAKYGSAEKARQVVEETAPKGGRGRAVHVRRVPSRARAHESQCVTPFFTAKQKSMREQKQKQKSEIIDLEAHGGLYKLHSHMNHSCNPNVSVRHLDQRTALSRITVIAKRDICRSISGCT